MIKEIYFISQQDAIELEPLKTRALISIRVPKGFVPLKEGWQYWHKSEFHDEEADEDGVWTLFNTEKAIDAISFVKGLPEHINTLYIHCHAGISRSAGMAKFFSEMFEIPFDTNYNRFNKLVYRLLWQAYYDENFR